MTYFLHYFDKFIICREIAQRTSGWSEALCAKLDEVNALHKAKSPRYVSYSLAMAAEACGVPYPYALLWSIK